MKDEKTSSPMFPRLHVNDKEKGGPRAPPRNKMALYEQLSIPSQRFNTRKVNSQVSSSEVQTQDINRCFRFTGQPSNSSASIGSQKLPVARINRGSHTTYHADKKRKLIDKDDFTVPVFEADQVHNNLGNTKSGDHNLPGNDPILKRASNRSCFDNSEDSPALSIIKPFNSQTQIDNRCDNSAKHRLSERFSSKIQESSVLISDTGQASSSDNHNKNSPIAKSSHFGLSPAKFCPRKTILDDDDESDASTADSVSGIDLSPDDVVKVIGKEHFWKARKMITNQQRMFMVQLFELHKLIKVQQMIAEDPDILLEGTINEQSKATLVEQDDNMCEAPPKELPLGNNVPSSFVTFTGNSEMRKEKSESSSVRKSTESESIHHMAIPAEGPWAFPHPLGHQWLVPVMTPSEGLVYKPYSFPVCNGCGSNQNNSQHHHHHGYGMIPCGTPYGALSPYGMRASTSGSGVDQSNMHGSNDVSSRKSGTRAQLVKCPPPSETHLMGSTASSSFQGEVSFVPVDGPQNYLTDLSSKVIKVVPRNKTSATESAVRIFESIQEERKRNDAV